MPGRRRQKKRRIPGEDLADNSLCLSTLVVHDVALFNVVEKSDISDL